jgi:hypothetical protein
MPLTGTGSRWIGHILKKQMPVIQRISGNGELNRTTPVLPVQCG